MQKKSDCAKKMKASILIVDDTADIRNSMSEFIEISGYKTLTASSAEEALELLQNNDVNIVLTDIMMPGMNGFQLTELVKKGYDSDVIVMTGYSGEYSYDDAINKGASDFIFKPVRFNELMLRMQRVLSAQQLRQEHGQMLKKLQKQAITDGLTQFFNARYFYSQLEIEIGRCNRYNHPLSLLFLDIDHFKRYNDTFGHIEGDEALIKVSKIVKSCLRTMDYACRYGGEEFTIILPETITSEAVCVAERIRNAMESKKFMPAPDKIVVVTISIGVTEYRHGERISDFVKRADRAMYISKEQGRNKVSVLFADGE